jgi:O-antigen ligase
VFNLSARRPAIFTLTAALLLMLPWLNPFAPGPSAAVAPWLFSMAMVAALLLLFAWRRQLWPEFPGPLGTETIDAFNLSLLVAGLLSSVLALLQYFDVEAMFAPWVNAAGPGQAFANLRQRNQFASLTNLALAVLLLWALHAKPGALNKNASALTLTGAALLAVGNAASASRTGGVQLLLLCALLALWGGWRVRLVRLVLICAGVAYATSAIALPFAAGFDWMANGLFARLQAGDQPCASRITLWSNVLHLMAQKPWLGWGWGELDYAHFITLYDQPRFCDILDNAHNLPLHLAVELGLPAALLICGGFMAWALRQKPWAERDPARQMAWAVLALILLHSLLEYPLWYGPFQIAFGVCVVLLSRQKKLSEVKNTSKNESYWLLAGILQALTAIILIACVSYAAWDYRRISQIYLPPELRAAAYRTDTLNQIRSSWLFADQVQFAELMTTPLTLANAEWTFESAAQMLHYSPEPRVIEKLIESAVLLGKEDDALAYLARYRAAFPAEHGRWAKAQTTRL